jgi:hypothetical protein
VVRICAWFRKKVWASQAAAQGAKIKRTPRQHWNIGNTVLLNPHEKKIIFLRKLSQIGGHVVSEMFAGSVVCGNSSKV